MSWIWAGSTWNDISSNAISYGSRADIRTCALSTTIILMCTWTQKTYFGMSKGPLAYAGIYKGGGFCQPRKSCKSQKKLIRGIRGGGGGEGLRHFSGALSTLKVVQRHWVYRPSTRPISGVTSKKTKTKTRGGGV